MSPVEDAPVNIDHCPNAAIIALFTSVIPIARSRYELHLVSIDTQPENTPKTSSE